MAKFFNHCSRLLSNFVYYNLFITELLTELINFETFDAHLEMPTSLNSQQPQEVLQSLIITNKGSSLLEWFRPQEVVGNFIKSRAKIYEKKGKIIEIVAPPTGFFFQVLFLRQKDYRGPVCFYDLHFVSALKYLFFPVSQKDGYLGEQKILALSHYRISGPPIPPYHMTCIQTLSFYIGSG